jgi:hypothetical protein
MVPIKKNDSFKSLNLAGGSDASPISQSLYFV